jgi:hypothetical protein
MAQETVATLNAVATDWRPSRLEARRAIRRAIITAAELNDGEVHVADVRPMLPPHIDLHQLGAFIAGLVSAGILVNTSEWRPYGGPKSSGNSHKPSRVRRLVRDIPEVEA